MDEKIQGMVERSMRAGKKSAPAIMAKAYETIGVGSADWRQATTLEHMQTAVSCLYAMVLPLCVIADQAGDPPEEVARHFADVLIAEAKSFDSYVRKQTPPG
jgi:hypothetical protein